MRRGDLYWVDLEATTGSEVTKLRPAIVVSNDAANRSVERTRRGVVTVVPVTSDTQRVLPFHVFLDAAECGLDTDSKAQAEQVRALAVQRLDHRIGTMPPATVDKIDNALRLHLGL